MNNSTRFVKSNTLSFLWYLTHPPNSAPWRFPRTDPEHNWCIAASYWTCSCLHLQNEFYHVCPGSAVQNGSLKLLWHVSQVENIVNLSTEARYISRFYLPGIPRLFSWFLQRFVFLFWQYLTLVFPCKNRLLDLASEISKTIDLIVLKCTIWVKLCFSSQLEET